jgi:hypothetical protein
MNKQLTECPENIELKHIDKFTVKDMKFKEEKDGGKLSKVGVSVKEKRVNLIWHFNYFFFQLNKMLISTPSKGFRGQKIANTSAANVFQQVKNMILTSVVMTFVDQKIDRMSTGSSKRVLIDRLKARGFIDSGKVDHSAEFTEFGQILKQLNGDMDCWRLNRPDD